MSWSVVNTACSSNGLGEKFHSCEHPTTYINVVEDHVVYYSLFQLRRPRGLKMEVS